MNLSWSICPYSIRHLWKSKCTTNHSWDPRLPSPSIKCVSENTGMVRAFVDLPTIPKTWVSCDDYFQYMPKHKASSQTSTQTALPMVRCILCNYQMHHGITSWHDNSIFHGSNFQTRKNPELWSINTLHHPFERLIPLDHHRAQEFQVNLHVAFWT